VGSLPILSGKDVVRVFETLGWRVARLRGSGHIIMVKDREIATLSVPDHKEVSIGTLRSLVRLANLTMDQFLASIE